ncbi:hypothetical protein JCM3770_007294 [Rhodotorula araucariae]
MPHGSGPGDRYHPSDASAVPSSSFHSAAPLPGPSRRRDVDGGPARAYAPGGEGFRLQPNPTLDFLSDFEYSYQEPTGPSTMRYDGFNVDQNKHAALQRQRHPSPRRQPRIVARGSPSEREHELAASRKREQEEAEQDRGEQERRYKQSEQAERDRRTALKRLRQDAKAASSSASSGSIRAPLKSSVDALFDGGARAADKGKKKAHSESPSKKKNRKDRGTNAQRVKGKRVRDKGKGKLAPFESEIEDSDDEPQRQSSGVTSATNRLSNMRGHFKGSPPSLSAPDPQAGRRRSPLRSQRAGEKSPSPVESIPTLDQMMQDEASHSQTEPTPRKRLRVGASNARRVASMRIDNEERVERQKDMDSPDELLEEYEDRPDSKTLCPFCDQPFPDHPSRDLLALKASLLRHPHSRRPTLKNKYAVRFPEGEHVVRTGAFCKMHHNERTVVPEGRARGYPRSIDWDALPKRIDRELSKHLTDVIFGTQLTPFLAKARAAWDAGEWKSVLSEYGSFDVEEPGYYGPRGFETIKTTLTALFINSMPFITPERTAPLSPDFYLRRVLVPECAVELIRADLDRAAAIAAAVETVPVPTPVPVPVPVPVPRARAERTRDESRAYGRAVFPAEADEEERREAAMEREAAEGRRKRRAGGGAVVAAEDEGTGEGKGKGKGRGKGKKRAAAVLSSSGDDAWDTGHDGPATAAASSDLETVSPARPSMTAFRLPKAVRAPAGAAGGSHHAAGNRVGRVPRALTAATPSASASASACAPASSSPRAGVSAGKPARAHKPANEITLPSSSSSSSSEGEVVVCPAAPRSHGNKSKKDKTAMTAKGVERGGGPGSLDALFASAKQRGRRSSTAEEQEDEGTGPTARALPAAERLRATLAAADADDDDGALLVFDDDEVRPGGPVGGGGGGGGFAARNRAREACEREEKKARRKQARVRVRKRVRGGRGSDSSSGSSEEG